MALIWCALVILFFTLAEVHEIDTHGKKAHNKEQVLGHLESV